LKHINTALKSLIEKAGFKKQLEQQKVLEMWGQIVGDAIAKNTEAVSVSQGTLVIKAKSAAWRQELQLQKREILESINTGSASKLIKDIRFV
tara:strand:+ start:14982 stop:15257 length:276 start_codon:yes stop_codon:yes gene_type:complete